MNKSDNIKSVTIDSDNVCFGPKPNFYDEVFQHLTINAKGRVWLTRYCFGDKTTGYILKSKHYLSIPKEIAHNIFKAISNGYFCETNDPYMVSDVGTWIMDIILNTEDAIEFTGSLTCCDPVGHQISEMIRKALNDSTIFALDGDVPVKTSMELNI